MRIIDLTKTNFDEPANQGVFFSNKSKEFKDTSMSKGLNYDSQAMQSIKNYKKIVKIESFMDKSKDGSPINTSSVT